MASIWQKKLYKKTKNFTKTYSKFNNFSLIYLIQLLQLKVADLINANGRVPRRLNKATTTQSYDTSCQEEVSSICNSMSPISKHKTLKRMSSIPGMILVKKRLHKFTNLRILMKMILFKNLVKKLFLSWWTMILHLSVETRKRRVYLIGRIELKFCTKSLCLRQWLNALHVVSVDMYQKIYWSQNLKLGYKPL